MTVQVREALEPSAELGGDWSGRGTGSPSLLASSHALLRLQREIERYVKREIGGRSILVSGHRGAGKTTLVLHAVSEVAKRLGSLPLRPLLIRVQGPDLVSEAAAAPPSNPPADSAPSAKSSAPASDDAKTAEAAKAATPTGSVIERALKQLTLAICRAAVERFSVAVRARCEPPVSATSTDSTASTDPAEAASSRSRGELAASFRLLLDDGPDPAALREVYRRLGVLDRGVLFDLPADKLPHDQAWRELVALASIAQAFRLISGRQAETSSATDALTRKRELKGVDLDPKAMQALASVIAGGLVGGGAAFAGGKPFEAALAAVGTALATTLGLAIATSWTRTRGSSRDYSFIRAYDASTLERQLPVLLDRLHDAGLAPVFMVDELDKLPEVERDMRALINRLKHLVSEEALFCFLTDREYYERLLASARREAYPLEHTYFSERLFATFRPQELHDYLDAVLEASDPRDATDKEALRYVLLHRSRMHMADLRAELAALRAQLAPRGSSSSAAALGLGTGELTTNFGYRHAIGLQLTVELLLSRDDLRQRLDQDPQFGQLAYDALYYVSRKWQEGKRLDVSRAAFDKYLAERMNPNRGDREAAVTEVPLREVDYELLHNLVLDLVRRLLDPETLRIEIEGGGLSGGRPMGIADVIPQLAERLIERVAGELEKYEWRFDSYGRRLPQERPAEQPTGSTVKSPQVEGTAVGAAGMTVPESPQPADAAAGRVSTPAGAMQRDVDALVQAFRRDEEYILGVDRAVREHTDVHSLATLADRLSILSSAPAWSQVVQAFDRSRTVLDTGIVHAGFDEDCRTVAEYRTMLEARTGIVATCIRYAQQLAILEAHQHLPPGRAPQPLDVSSALETLAAALRLRAASTVPRMASLLAAYGEEAFWRHHFDASIGENASVFAASLEFPGIDVSPEQSPAHAEERSWEEWEARLREWLLSGKTEFAATEAYVRARWRRRPSAWLDLDLKMVTIGTWSQIAFGALAGTGMPHWPFLPAIMRLNLLPGDVSLLPPTFRKHEALLEDATLRRWLALAERRMSERTVPAERGVITAELLGRLTGTPGWIPSEKYGVLALSGNEPEGVLETLIALAVTHARTIVAVGDTEQEALLVLEKFKNRVPNVLFAATILIVAPNVARASVLRQGTRWPVVPADTGFEAAMDQALTSIESAPSGASAT